MFSCILLQLMKNKRKLENCASILNVKTENIVKPKFVLCVLRLFESLSFSNMYYGYILSAINAFLVSIGVEVSTLAN